MASEAITDVDRFVRTINTRGVRTSDACDHHSVKVEWRRRWELVAVTRHPSVCSCKPTSSHLIVDHQACRQCCAMLAEQVREGTGFGGGEGRPCRCCTRRVRSLPLCPQSTRWTLYRTLIPSLTVGCRTLHCIAVFLSKQL